MKKPSQTSEEELINNCKAYIENYRIGENKYTTGLFDTGITIYKQQVRALNIFYAMQKVGLIKQDTSMCIIGGGVAGLTFAAACISSGIPVEVLEKEPIFLHLQHGCDIRPVHPHLYDWPERGSLYPYAKLPVLSWKANSASNVAKQIFNSFYALQSANKTSLFHTSVKTNDFTVTRTDNIYKIKTSGNYRGLGIEKEINAYGEFIIYCTGYGIEKGTEKMGVTPSYWRNDDFAQMVVNDKNKFYISGSGDGALIDLYRLKILGFNYDLFLEKYRLYDDHEGITAILNQIRSDWRLLSPDQVKAEDESNKKNNENENWLLNKFDRLPLGFIDFMADKLLANKIRDNIAVSLVGERDINKIYSLNKMSLINALMLFIIRKHSHKTFDFIRGKTMIDNGRRDIVDVMDENKILYKLAPGETLIIRHGTERRTVLENAKVSEGDIKKLYEKQTQFKSVTDAPLWNFASIVRLFKGSGPLKSYCSNETVSFCSNFIAVLNKLLLQECGKAKIDYRLTLLRVMELDNQICYQQMSQYYGSKLHTGDVGSIFPIESGNVGYSVFTGKPLLLKNNNGGIAEISKILNISPQILYRNNSFLSIPILAKTSSGSKAVNLILFCDSKKPDFFTDKIILTIISALEGFVDSIHKSLGKQIMMMDELNFDPIVVTDNKSILRRQFKGYDKIQNNSCYVDGFKDKQLKKRLSYLILNEFYSFDIYHDANFKDDIFSFNKN